MNIRSVGIAAISLLMIAATSVRAQEQIPDKQPVNPQSQFSEVVPLDTGNQLVSHEVRVMPGITAGVDYQILGVIALGSGSGMQVLCDGTNTHVSVGTKNIQFQYVLQRYTIQKTSPLGNLDVANNSAVYKLRYAIPKARLPWNGGIAFGGDFYVDGPTHFTQPYVVGSLEYGAIRTNIGINWLTGDVPHENGDVFGSLQIAVSPEFVVYVDYSRKDFHKAMINEILLPAVGVDCSACSKDATTAGMSFQFAEEFIVGMGIYDIGDLFAPFGNITYRRNY